MSAVVEADRLLGPPRSAAEHRERYGPLPVALDLAEVQRSGLTGRGGAGFPVHRKLVAMRPGGTVVANGAEGEPASGKDAALLRTAPHLVLDGLLLAARATGARHAVIAVKADLAAVVEAALGARPDARSVRLHVVPPGFVRGEASALVAGIAGRRPVPMDRPVRLVESGLRRRPTLVQNVETLAHLALVAREGADGFRSAGTADDPGTRLLTVSGDAARPGVLEVPGGIRLLEVLDAAGADRGSAVLVGGDHGRWVRDVDLRLGPTDGPGRVRAGAGVVVVLAPGRCGVRATTAILRRLAEATAGQCGPCVNGLPALARAFEKAAGGDPQALAEVRRLAGVVTGAGACHHPDGTAGLALSAVGAFADELDRHARGACTGSRS